MSQHDQRFYNNFMLVLGAIGLFTVLIVALAVHLHKRDAQAQRLEEPRYQLQVEDQIRSFAVPVTTDTPLPKATVVKKIQKVRTALETYNFSCVACHSAGVAGAPKTGDTSAWASRITKGNETLYAHAINGFKTMPAKGGYAMLSDDEVASAVDYMLEQLP